MPRKIDLNDPRYVVEETPSRINLSDNRYILDSRPSPPPQVSKTESALRGGAQGLSFGFADEATARLESITKDVPYEKALEETRAAYRQAQEANPITYTGSEIAGGVLPALIPGVGQATAGASLGRLAAIGAGTGALSGLGYSEGETAGQIARDVAIGGALGGALPVLGAKLFPKKLQSEISKKAGETVSKEASQATGKEITKETIGQAAKKEGIPLQELEKSLQNAQSAAQENLGAKLSQADELIATLTGKKESLINF